MVFDEVKAAKSAELGILAGDEVEDKGEEEVVNVVLQRSRLVASNRQGLHPLREG